METKYRQRLIDALRFVLILSVVVLVALGSEEWNRGLSIASILASVAPIVLLLGVLGLAGPLLLWWIARGRDKSISSKQDDGTE